ncbi:MAG: hypothetical protein LUG18_10935 [Candidatus Azobacteroides sp.]|nr:hypothetical protein [Candidatus Azobacteroides sp.]
MKKKYMMMVLGIFPALCTGLMAQAELSDANMVITNFTHESFLEGTNTFSSGTANKVRLTLLEAGDGSTTSFSPAQGVTCDGALESTVVRLAYRTSQPQNYSCIQVENLGTATITHVAFRGWYNVPGQQVLTYGYSTNTDQEEDFIVPLDSWMEEDTPLYFGQYCSLGTSFDGTDKVPTPGARYIRLSSNPSFPNLGKDVFYNSSTDVSIWGIYIWTDDQGIPSSAKQAGEENLSYSYGNGQVSFSQMVNACVYDPSGKAILSLEKTQHLEMHRLPKGLYLLRAKAGNGQQVNAKIHW